MGSRVVTRTQSRTRINGLGTDFTDDYYDRIKDESSLVAYFPLNVDNGGRVLDSHGGRVGTIGGDASIGSASVPYGDNAMTFDGTNDWVDIPYSAALNPAAITVEMWVKRGADSGGIERLFDNCAGNKGFRLGINASDVFHIISGDGSSLSESTTGGAATVGEWNHIAGVQTGTTATLYVNGVQVGTASDGYSANTSAGIRIGALLDGSQDFTGSIAHVAIYNAALSQAKINRHYSAFADAVLQLAPVGYWRLHEASGASTAVDLSGNGNDGTHTSVTRLDEAGALTDDPSGSTGYDGSADYTTVSYDAAFATAELTAMCFMRMDSSHTGTGICFHCSESTYTEGWTLWFNSSDQINARIGSDLYLHPSGSTEEQWYFVAMTHDGTTKKVYIDGVEVDSADVAVGTLNSAGDLHIGAGEGAALKHKGNVQEATYFDKALTADEISRLHSIATSGIRPLRGVA